MSDEAPEPHKVAVAQVRTVLLLDDDQSLLEILSILFEGRQRFRSITTDCGEEALRLARKSQLDVAILDVNVPGLNGYQVSRAIKTDPTTRHIKVIMMTADVSRPAWYHIREARADDCVMKPFPVSELLRKVDQLLT